MLYAVAFERWGVVLGDLYFLDPEPDAGQEGAERGVRLEVRLFDRPPAPGSVYASRPISVGRPIWRADLLESADGQIGSSDRTHHHPQFTGWEPSARVFEEALTADPVAWVGDHLRKPHALLAGAGLDPQAIGAEDITALRASVPEILELLERLLMRVRSGELATAPSTVDETCIRSGWL